MRCKECCESFVASAADRVINVLGKFCAGPGDGEYCPEHGGEGKQAKFREDSGKQPRALAAGRAGGAAEATRQDWCGEAEAAAGGTTGREPGAKHAPLAGAFNTPQAEAQWALGALKDHNPLRRAASAATGPKPIAEDWAAEMRAFWRVGEAAAHERLETFCEEVLAEGHFEGRERFRADREYTAILSPYIRFGELSSRTCFARGSQVAGLRRR